MDEIGKHADLCGEVFDCREWIDHPAADRGASDREYRRPERFARSMSEAERADAL